jgi:hypothetical protein
MRNGHACFEARSDTLELQLDPTCMERRGNFALIANARARDPTHVLRLDALHGALSHVTSKYNGLPTYGEALGGAVLVSNDSFCHILDAVQLLQACLGAVVMQACMHKRLGNWGLQ